MAKTIKKHWDIAAVIGIGLTLAIAGILVMSGMIALPSSVSAATETVSVSATIEQWLSLQVSTNTMTITPALVTAAGGTQIGTSNYVTSTAGTNATSGFSIQIKSDSNAGLCHEDGCGTYKIASATTTVVAGEDHYGAQATSSTMTVKTKYDHWDASNDVGGLATTSDTVSTFNTNGEETTTLRLKASALKTDPDGAYSDNLTLTCVAGVL